MYDTLLNHAPMFQKWLDFIFQGKQEREGEGGEREKFRETITTNLSHPIFFSYRDTTWGSPILVSMDGYYKILSDLNSIAALQDRLDDEYSDEVSGFVLLLTFLFRTSPHPHSSPAGHLEHRSI